MAYKALSKRERERERERQYHIHQKSRDCKVIVVRKNIYKAVQKPDLDV
jgi:hypothetical protein